MIQCAAVNVTNAEEKETVRFILVGPLNYPIYVPAADGMFAGVIPVKI